MTFKELNLRDELLLAIKELGFEQPMPIQERAIPFIQNQDSDLVALAQTGTGKTAAFGLPILNMLDESAKQTQALILSPTRELCIQISNELKNYSHYLKGMRVVAVYGGEDIRIQLKQLAVPPQIIVATPGRLMDLMKRKKVETADVRFLVLDEADVMLNMGFRDDIESILKQMPETRRTLLFSATMPKEIANIVHQFMKNYEEIVVGTKNSGAANVEHVYYLTSEKYKYAALKRIVDLNPDIYGIIFCRTRQETKEVAEKLMQNGYNADALHGDLSQAQRDTVMQKFRIRNIRLLVATDVAARGLDVGDLTHVINYNLPDDPEVYTHRSGRTGRVNKKGVSIALILPKEIRKIKALEKMLKKNFVQQQIPNGQEVMKKQLHHLIDRMMHVEVKKDQIQPYMGQMMEQLEYLSKEELLKRFVSLEFNRFPNYGNEAEDLNEVLPREEKSAQRQNKKQAQKTGKRIRLKLNIGGRQGIDTRRFLGIFNEMVGDKSINVGSIEITKKFTFFEVFADQTDKIMNAFASNPGIEICEVKRDKQHGRLFA
jgi:ATP-dependent RNA helicase DeaD